MKCLCKKDFYEKSSDFEIKFVKDMWYQADDMGLSYKICDEIGNGLVFSIVKGDYIFSEYFITQFDYKLMLENEYC